MESHVFGPVPSRRLGMSLGVDLLPVKTCSFDCVYCQVGRTTFQTSRRRAFFPTEAVLADIQAALRKNRKIDYITFSGSGEPTLAANLGEIIRAVRTITDIPIALITNSSLLGRRAVADDAALVHLIVPSLDAATEAVFQQVNRPCAGISAASLVEALVGFRKRFTGQFWLEVLLVRGVNDSPREIAALRKAISRIAPDKIHLNTVVRPPSEPTARRLSQSALEGVARRISAGFPVEIVAPFQGKLDAKAKATQDEVLAILKRRSCTAKDIAVALGIHPTTALKYAERLVSAGNAQAIHHGQAVYYLSPSK